MKPAWLLVVIVGLGAWVALTREHRYAPPAAQAEQVPPPAVAAASPDDLAPEQVVEDQAAPPAPDSAGDLSGEVLESQDVASYTYLRLKTPAGEVWAAVPRAAVRVHDQVQITGASLMRNFASKTLKRTFPSIYFGSLAGASAAAGSAAPRTGSGAALPPGHPNVGNSPLVNGDDALPPGHPPIGSTGADPYAAGTPLPPGHPHVESL